MKDQAVLNCKRFCSDHERWVQHINNAIQVDLPHLVVTNFSIEQVNQLKLQIFVNNSVKFMRLRRGTIFEMAGN